GGGRRGLGPPGGGRATRVHLERRRDDGPRARTPRRGGQHRDRRECAWRRARRERNPAVSEERLLIGYQAEPRHSVAAPLTGRRWRASEGWGGEPAGAWDCARAR